MDKAEIAKETARALLDCGAVLVNTKEPFTYTSGKQGPVYVDVSRILSQPEYRNKIMDLACKTIEGLNYDYLAGGETAGISPAAMIADRLNAPMTFVRKKPKAHGAKNQIVGTQDIEGKTFLLVEDLMNRGTSQKTFVDAIRGANAKVTESFVIFHYDLYPHITKEFEELGVSVHGLTSWRALVDLAQEENLFDASTIDSMNAFINDPENWKQAA